MHEQNEHSAATVYVVDDDNMARESLTWLLSSVGVKVSGYEHGCAFLDVADADMCGCVLLDMRMPGIDGLETHKRLVALGIHLPVIIMTGHADVPMALRATRAGVFDFIEKPYNDQLMIEQVQRALEFDQHSRCTAQRLAGISVRFERLSAREQQVLAGVLDGKPNKGIAAELHISPKTVELHRANLMQKVGADTLVELVRMSIAVGVDKGVPG